MFTIAVNELHVIKPVKQSVIMKKKNLILKKLSLRKKSIASLDGVKGGIWATHTCGTTCLPVNETINPFEPGDTIQLLSIPDGLGDCNYSRDCSASCASVVLYNTCAHGDKPSGAYHGQG